MKAKGQAEKVQKDKKKGTRKRSVRPKRDFS